MRRTLKIYRTAWTRFGNCPDSCLRALPQSGSGKRYRPAPFFFFQQGRVCRFSGSPRGASPACSCVAGTTAFVKRTRSQPRQRGCSQGLGYGPNKQKLRFPATPGTAVSSLCGNKGTACQVAHTRLYELWTIHFFLRKAFAPLLPSELPVVARSYKRWTYVSVVVLHKAFLLCCR